MIMITWILYHCRISHEKIKKCSDHILSKTKHRPKIGIICGSGLGTDISFTSLSIYITFITGGLGDLVSNPDVFPYEDIPGFPKSTVEGDQ